MNILFVGFGPHTRRIQFPYCIRERAKLDINGMVVLDLTAQRHAVEDELKKYTNENIDIKTYYTDKYIDEALLKNIITRHHINRVILGTDPEHHSLYLKFLIENDMSVLMDKPITAIPEAATDSAAARKIHDDFTDLNQLYIDHPKSKVTVLSQRRYHPGYLKIRDDIIGHYNKFDIIPHYLYLLHSDGQLRILNEIDDISYHGFSRGYGKISHSGYHFIDTLYVYLRHFITIGKIDNYTIHCHALQPGDYSKQITNDTISKLFKHAADPYTASSMGEVDAYITIQFKKDEQLVSSARIDMLHSGFSDRLSAHANYGDLYKGNGRIRHEKQIILQGPIYAAYIDSLQSKQINLKEKGSLSDIGGEHHFDLTRFHHTATGKEVISTHTVADLMPIANYGRSRGHQEEARFYCLEDFFASTNKNRRSEISDLSDHYFSSLMMSKFYEALSTGKQMEGAL